jgi:CIC family chloride channel protein
MSDRTRFAAGLIVVAAGAATFAIVFRASLNLVYRIVYGADNVVSAISTLPRWTRVVVLITVAAIAGMVARLRAARAQGVSNVMEAIALGNVHLSLSTTISRVVASWTALAGGMSIGREGPLIEFGGSLGAAVGRLFATSLNHTRVLVAAGTAAGFAARDGGSVHRNSTHAGRSRRRSDIWPASVRPWILHRAPGVRSARHRGGARGCSVQANLSAL